MKIGLKLAETGYRFGTEERARIYLTNALEPWVKQLPLIGFDALAHEATAVNEIKRHKRFTVVIGNPPYSLLSANLKAHHRRLVEDYKFVNGERIHERGALQLEKNLNDDYVKFVRLTQLTIERTGVGVSGLITNHSFLYNPTMRGVRWSLLQSASHIWLNDLHGNSTKQEQPPDGGADVNVFQIKQGVAITLSVRLTGANGKCEAKHHELWGTRQSKEAWLTAHRVGNHEWQRLEPTPDHYLFIPQSSALKSECEAWPSLPDVMLTNGAGYITARDNLVIDFDRDAVIERVRAFNASRQDDASLLKAFDVADKKGWDVQRARAELKHIDIPKRVIKTNYRPFDSRWIFFDSTLVWGRSWPTMQHVVGHPGNLTLLATRMTKDQWDVWVARTVSSHKAMSAYDTNSVFPLYLAGDSESSQRSLASEHRINLSTPFLRLLAGALGLQQRGAQGLPAGLTPEDIIQYAYAVFHSSGYRGRYAEFLKIDFPRLPLTANLELFRELARLGGGLVALHLLESPKLDQRITEFIGGWNPEVEKLSWSRNTVWVDKAQTSGFKGVCQDVWNFHVGGYQVCEKWLKDRKGRTLSKDDVTHYQKIVVALAETIRLMKEIDQVIEAHGGWPGAFVREDPGLD
jgi:predicted helicase